MNKLSDTSISLIVLLLALLVTVGIQAYLWPHVTDDAYISFRYAFHMASGDGLVFNPGERVEGFSNPLWTLFLGAAFSLTSLPLPDIARAAGLLATLGILFIVVRLYRTHFHALGSAPLSLSLLFLVLTPGFHVYATAGLEGPLLSFLIVLGTARSLRPDRGGWTAALIFGLVGITRPEGPLYALLWFIATLRGNESTRRTLLGEIPRFAAMVALPAVWQIFRLSYYGGWFPNTALAKVPGVFGEFIGFPEYVTPWIVAAGGPAVILAWFLISREYGETRMFDRMALALTGGCAVFVVYARGDWMEFGRFILPVWPLMAVVLSNWFCQGVRPFITHERTWSNRAAWATPFFIVILSSFLAWRGPVENYAANKGMNMLMRGTDQLAVGTWINNNISRDATLATGRLGGIGFGAVQNVLWDWFGLTDAEEARFIRQGRPGTIADDPVFRRKPDVIAAIEAPADWSYTRTTQMMEYLKKDYQFLLGFPQGNYGYVDIWIRKDRLDQVLETKDQFVIPGPGIRD